MGREEDMMKKTAAINRKAIYVLSIMAVLITLGGALLVVFGMSGWIFLLLAPIVIGLVFSVIVLREGTKHDMITAKRADMASEQIVASLINATKSRVLADWAAEEYQEQERLIGEDQNEEDEDE